MGTAATIPMMGKPVQIDSPLQTVGGLMQLRASMNEQALRQAQTVQAQQNAADIAVQAASRQRALQDQQTIMQGLGKPEVSAAVKRNDWSYFDGKVLQGNLQPIQKNFMDMAAAASHKDTEDLTNEGKRLEMLADSLGNMRNAKHTDGTPFTPAERASQYAASYPNLQAAGLFKDMPNPPPSSISGTDEDFDRLESQLNIKHAINIQGAALAKTAAETAEAAGKGVESQAKAKESGLNQQLIQSKIDHYNTLTTTPEALTAYVGKSINQQKYPAEFARTLNEAQHEPDLDGINKVIAKHSEIVGQQEKTIATETNPAVIQARAETQARAQQMLETLTPTDMAVAKDIADYKQQPITGFALARPQGRAIMSAVSSINPDYHSEYYANFNKTESDAVTGNIGKSARALNTMMGHLSVLKHASDALNTGNVQVLNQLALGVGVQFGADPKTTYDTIVHRLGPEITTAYVAAGGTAGERGTNEEDFNSKQSPQQRNSNIGVSAFLANSKIDALNYSYQQGTYGRGKQQLISPVADQARKDLINLAPSSIKGTPGTQPTAGMTRIRASDGSQHDIPTNRLDDARKIDPGLKTQ